MEPITLICPHCNARLKVKSGTVRSGAPCPRCRTPIAIEAARTAPPLPGPTARSTWTVPLLVGGVILGCGALVLLAMIRSRGPDDAGGGRVGAGGAQAADRIARSEPLTRGGAGPPGGGDRSVDPDPALAEK